MVAPSSNATPLEGAAPKGARRVRDDLRDLAVLGGPITLSFLGNQLLGFVDTAMVGRLDAASLAAVGIGNGVYFTLSLVAMGIVLGIDPLVSQSEGAGDTSRSRAALWQGARIALLASIPCMGLSLLATRLIGHAGIDATTAEHIFQYVLGRLFNMVPFLLVTAGRTYLQGIGRTRAVLMASVWTNIANVIGNIIFIYGDDGLARLGLPRVGLPPLGVFGAGLSSTIASFVTCAAIFGDIFRRGGAPRRDDLRDDPEMRRAIVRVGWPIGLHLLAEVGAFSLAGLFAGWLGPLAVAGHQVALTLASASFMIALGLSNATSVLVGRSVGRGDAAGARRVGIVGIATTVGAMSVSALVFALAPELCASILSDKPDIIAAAVPLLRIAAVFQLADGAQAVAAGALRGAGDTRSASTANMIGYYALGIPLALLLGFPAGMGARGIWWGLTAALFAVGITLVVRFTRMSASEIRRL